MYSHALRRLALVTGLVGLVSPVASAAASAAPSVSRPVVHHMIAGHSVGDGSAYRSASQRLAAAMAAAPNVAAAEHVWMRHQARAALTHFAAADAPADASSVSSPFALLQAPIISAGDLTGNGRRDVLQLRLTPTRDFFTVSMTARDALTGRELWTRRAPKTDQEVLPLAIGKLGSPAQRGLFVLQLAVQTLSKHSFRVSETITAWSGKTGKTVWTSAPVTGTETDTRTTESGTNFPDLAQTFQPTFGPLDALITTSTFTLDFSGPTPTPSPSSAAAVFISGTDGSSSSPYPALSSTIALPSLQAVDDLNGDGLDDVLAITPGKPGSMTAERGDTGATIWSVHRNITDAGFATSVGRLTGGKDQDLAIQGGRVSLIRASDGKLLWTRRGLAEAVPLGPVRPGRSRALALVAEVESDSSSSTGSSRETNAIRIRAVTAANKVVWHTRVAASVGSKHGQQFSRDAIDLNTVDVQPDGTEDFSLRLAVANGHKHAKQAGLVNGRSGKFRARLFGPATAGSLVHGEGTDLVRANTTKGGILIRGYDGASGQLVMRRLVQTPGHARGAFAAGLRATGHGCSDIETGSVFRRGRVVLDMLSGSGARLWSVRYGLRHLGGGRLIHYKAPQRFCAASR
jgi:hypothetical protein